MTRYGKSTFEVRVQRLNETPGSMRVDDASSAATYWREKITAMPWYDPEREMCVAVMLNTRLSPVGHTLVGIGTLNECTVHPRDVFRAAVAMAAYAVLVIHNHPSGQAVPSEADRRITQRLAEAGRIIQINLIDHLIVGTNSCFSFREAGLL
jgi:DNA repair protein RadC